MIDMLAPYDLVAIKANSLTYYCFFVKDNQTMLAYPGEAGYASFLKSFSDTRDEGTPLKDFNRKIEQDVLIISPAEEQPVLEKRPLEDVRIPEDTTMVEHLLLAVLKSKDSFVRWKDKVDWKDKNRIPGSIEDVAPMIDEDGMVSPLFVKDISITFDHAVASISDTGRITELKRKKQQETTIVYASIFVCPLPIGSKYPFAQILFDKTHHKPIDAMMVDDFEAEHTSFVEHFLAYCANEGLPAAMHCMDERSFYLFKDVCSSLGIMVTIMDKPDEEMDKVCSGYVQAVASVIKQGMAQEEHHHDETCGCEEKNH